MQKFNKSPLWDSILESNAFQDIDIDTFKGGANLRIVQYDHETYGMLFLKNIIFQMAKKMGDENLSLLNNVMNRHVGGGLTINYSDMQIDLDYLLALDEVLFLQSQLQSIDSMLEIGAGYGRTCHTILSLFPNLKTYHIIDLPNMLELSHQYLEKVLDRGEFSKIKFIPVSEITASTYDLVINIDSMQEMNQEVVESYLHFIDCNANSFYSKNTVGKFDPRICGKEKTKGYEMALSAGILREVVDIFCPRELEQAQQNFLSRFSPGKDWIVEKHSETLPWSHYYQALYVKK